MKLYSKQTYSRRILSPIRDQFCKSIAITIFLALVATTSSVGQEVWNTDLEEGVNHVSFSSDGTRVAIGTNDGNVWDDGNVWILDAATGSVVRKVDAPANVYAVSFWPNGRRVVSGTRYGSVSLWNSATGDEVQRLEGHGDDVTSFAYSRDSTRLASGSLDHTVRLWDTTTGDEVWRFNTGRDVLSIAYSPDGARLAYFAEDFSAHEFIVLDTTSGDELLRLGGFNGFIYSIEYSPEGTRIASGGTDGSIRIWDAVAGDELRRFEAGHSVRSVAYSPDGYHLALPCTHKNDLTMPAIRAFLRHSSA